MKTCSSCGVAKDLTEFQVRKASKDGLTASCKACLKIRDAEKHQKFRDKRLEGMKAYARSDKGKMVLRTARRKNNSLYPERYAAKNAVSNAVRDGRLVKPEACWYCGKGGRIEGHHADYSRPLDVIWLCVECHKEVHRMTDEICLGQSSRQSPVPSSSSTSSSSPLALEFSPA